MPGVFTIHGNILHRLCHLAGAGAVVGPVPSSFAIVRHDVRSLRTRPGLLAGATLGMLGLAALLTLPQWMAPWRWPTLQQMHQRTASVELFDARGRWLGVMPSMLQHGEYVHKDIIATQVPRGFIEVLLALEDRHLERRTIHGIDVLRIGLLAARWATGNASGGGSGVSMQLARALHHMRPDGQTPVVWRKLIEVVDGMVLHHRLGGRDSPAFQRWLASHLPLAIGAPGHGIGGEIRGVEMAARVLWGIPARHLNLAQQALLAAAVRRPVLLAPTDDAASLALSQRRWAYLRQRAAHGLKLAYGDTDPAVRHALASLATMPLPRPDIRPLARLAAPHDSRRRLRLAANAQMRAASMLGHAVWEAHQALHAWHGAAYARTLRQASLTLDAAANLRLRRRVRALLQQMQHHPRLLASLNNADLLIAVADDQGRVRRFYSSRAGIWRGRYMPGSVAKMIAAVALAEQGDAADTIYCRQPATSCNGLTAQQAFARSDNAAIQRALLRVPAQRLRQLAWRFGLRLHAEVPPATALTLGLADTTPRQVLGMMLQITQLARQGHTHPLQPALLHGAPFSASSPTRWQQHPSWYRKGMPALQLDAPRRGYLAAVLEAPLQTGGTMHRVTRLAPDVHWLQGKTGTVDSSGSATRGKWMVASFLAGDKPHALVVMVSARRNMPLGRKLGDILAPLAAAAAQSMADTNQ